VTVKITDAMQSGKYFLWVEGTIDICSRMPVHANWGSYMSVSTMSIHEDRNVRVFTLFEQGNATFFCFVLLCSILTYIPTCNSVEGTGNLISYPVKVAGHLWCPRWHRMWHIL
jgi:hypothetical protein